LNKVRSEFFLKKQHKSKTKGVRNNSSKEAINKRDTTGQGRGNSQNQ
jgi:cell division protein FtsW (lipid II flippase)